MRKIIFAAAAILAATTASSFAESENTTLQSLRHQQLIEASQGVGAGATSFGLSNPGSAPAVSAVDVSGQTAGQSRATTELRRMTYGD